MVWVWVLRGMLAGMIMVPSLGWLLTLPLGFALLDAGWPATAAFGLAWTLVGMGYTVGVFAWARATHKSLRYDADDHGLSIRRGLIQRANVWIPWSRIRDVRILRGPFLRLFGLATLRFRVDDDDPHRSWTDTQMVGVRDASTVAALVLSRARRPPVQPAPTDATGPREGAGSV